MNEMQTSVELIFKLVIISQNWHTKKEKKTRNEKKLIKHFYKES